MTSPQDVQALEMMAQRLGLWTGIDFARGGQNPQLERFLDSRVQELGLPSRQAYVNGLTGPTHPEVTALMNAVTVGHTWFYRDGVLLELLLDTLRTAVGTNRPAQVWVPGCATGEDVYTLAMMGVRSGVPLEILGSDINTEHVSRARDGHYSAWSAWEMPADLRAMLETRTSGSLKVPAGLKKNVRVVHHNVMDPPLAPLTGEGWDLILCRNVFIYFCEEHMRTAIQRMGQALREGGWLVLGGAEVLHSAPSGLSLQPLGPRFGLRRSPAGRTPERSGSGPSLPPPAPSGPRLGSVATGAPRTTLPPVPLLDLQKPGATAAVSTQQAGMLVKTALPLIRSGQLGQALKVLQGVLERDPLCVEARLWMGVVHHLNADPTAAMESLRSALTLEPTLWPAAYYLALSYEKLGMKPAAEREYRRVLETQGCRLPFQGDETPFGDLDLWKGDIVAIAGSRLRMRQERV